MTSFKPLWATPAAAPRGGASSGAKKSAAGAGGNFNPLWLDLPSARDFLVDNQVVTAIVEGVPGASNASPKDAGAATLPSAADGDDAVLHRGDSAAGATAGAGPEESGSISATQIITREEHVRLLALERQAGVEAGKVEGLAQAKKNLQSETKKIEDFLLSVEAAFGEKSRFLDPLKKLAVHIAKEIVRGELQASGTAINRLVEHCVASGGAEKPVAIHVNAQDLEWLKAVWDVQDGAPELKADDRLARGSVKVMMNDGWIEDLIERRFEDVETSLHLN